MTDIPSMQAVTKYASLDFYAGKFPCPKVTAKGFEPLLTVPKTVVLPITLCCSINADRLELSALTEVKVKKI